MATSSERAAHNESLFRSVNERIEETAIRWGTAEGGMEAVCECDRIDCEDRIHLSVAEYEQVRANPRHFVVLPEHHDDAVEVVHRDEGRFLVIRKVGDAGRAAERAEEGR
jgi:hypothetical protein